jgi:hypothetical protein
MGQDSRESAALHSSIGFGSMTTQYEGFEAVEDEGFMAPKLYKCAYRCEQCDHTWTKTFKAVPKHDPKCPNKRCAEAREMKQMRLELARMQKMLAEGTGPAHIGENVKVKAIDQTAEVVMADYKMTDLKDSIRPGENMAPKLPAPMQTAADNFFSAGAKATLGGERKINTRMQNRMAALGARAIAGGLRDSAVAPNQVLPKTQPPVITTVNPGYNAARVTAEGNANKRN